MRVIQIDLNKNYQDVIEEAVRTLSYGGTIIYPTDTLYGLGANALDDISVRKVFNIKNRPFSKPLPIIARNMMWVEELAEVSPKNRKILEKIWPGRVTAVLPKKEVIPKDLTSGQNTIGIRIPDHKFLDEFLKCYGYPLISTSASISGQQPTRDINEIIKIFEKNAYQPNLVIDAGILPQPEPSTVLDLTGSVPKILRVGPSRPDQLLKLLEF